MTVRPQEAGDFCRYMHSLQLEAATAVDIARLSEHVVHDRAALAAGRFAPRLNACIPTTTVNKKLVPKSLMQSCRKCSMLLPNDEMEKVGQEATVIDGGGEEGVCAYCAASLFNEPPMVWAHGFEPMPN